MSELKEELISKIKILSDTVWDGRATREEVKDWLDNFQKGEGGEDCEQLHALYLLSQFMYFSSREIRELIKSIYRDLFKYPVVESIRMRNHDTTDIDLINTKFDIELGLTRFLAVGNPSESSSHLLYYYRQENRLSRKLFISAHEIFDFSSIDNFKMANPQIKQYVFIDDFCGGGTQAKRYLKNIVERIKSTDPNIKVDYYVLFANCAGLDYLKEKTKIDRCDAVFKLDETYKCFGENSRHKPDEELGINWKFTREMVETYGKSLYDEWPLGHGNCQLLIGFFHNTPNNTLPIIWSDKKNESTWEPIFRRYPKVYGDGQ